MMKLLLVDDEAPTKMKLSSIIHWEKFGIDEIVQAENGLDALEKCADFEPDILLTDIRMPMMDGVQLANRMVEKFPRIKIIFISGYADKEYMKNAIRLGAVRYIEKPIQIDELTDALKSTVEMIANESRQHDQLSTVRKMAELQRKEATALWLAGVGAGKRDNPPPEPKEFSLYITVLVKVIENQTLAEKLGMYEKLADLLYDSRENLNQPGFHFCFTHTTDPMIIHIMSKSSDTDIKNYMAASNFCSLFKKKAWLEHIPTVTAVGELARSASALRHSYETAVMALNHTFFKEPGCICFYKRLPKPGFKFPQQYIDEFSDALSGENSNYAEQIIRSIALELNRYPNLPREQILRYFYSMACKLIQYSDEYSASVFSGIGEAQDIWVHINKYQFLNQLVDFMIAGVEEYFSQLNGGQYDNRIVRKIIKYIRKHYADPNLSIITVSDHVNLSPTYICRIFKETTETTINKYILQQRMQKAQQLIRENQIKVNEIARAVGYRNGNYFSFQFKKFNNCSPSEYRERMR